MQQLGLVLNLLGLLIQLNKHRHLGFQSVRIERLDYVVNRTKRIPP